MISNIEIGAKYRGNVNGAILEIVKIENQCVLVKDCVTGKINPYGLEAFKHCLLTRLDKKN